MVKGPQRRREKMSQELEEHDSRQRNHGMDYAQISIRETVLCCKVEGVPAIKNSIVRIEAHLASIAQSFASIDQSLAIIAAAQTKLEEK
jgi:hypothetical protein